MRPAPLISPLRAIPTQSLTSPPTLRPAPIPLTIPLRIPPLRVLHTSTPTSATTTSPMAPPTRLFPLLPSDYHQQAVLTPHIHIYIYINVARVPILQPITLIARLPLKARTTILLSTIPLTRQHSE